MSRLTLSDLPGAEGAPQTSRRSAAKDLRGRRRRRRTRALVVILVCLAVLGGGAFLAADPIRDVYGQLTEPNDFSGEGTGSVDVEVTAGSSGRTIGQALQAAGVVKTAAAFVDVASDDARAATIAPGTYALRTGMSASAALELLLDPASLQSYRITLPEGFTVAQSLERIAETTDLTAEELTAAAADPAVNLPAEAGGDLEGYLFPATYDFGLDVTAVDVISTMVARAQTAMDELGIPADQRHAVLTTASLVQAESGSTEDMGKVSRVIANRLSIGMMLQFDTTVNYANGKSGLTTTAEDRALDSPYNTYLYAGLPPGPINNPGSEALAAALAPVDGSWLYFVVTDPDTGATAFATTKEEHDANVEVFRAWLRANPQG